MEDRLWSATSSLTSGTSVTEPWIELAPVGMASALPVKRSSRTVTRAPASTRRRVTAEPDEPGAAGHEDAASTEGALEGPFVIVASPFGAGVPGGTAATSP